MKRLTIVYTMAVIGALSLTACSRRAMQSEAPLPWNSGTLVIIGGGLQRDNEAIYGRILQLAQEGTIGIIPTASGVPEEVGPEYVEDFENFGGPGRGFIIDIPFTAPEEAANPLRAEEIRKSAGLFFTGGDQSRILRAFRPEEGDTVSYRAVREVLAKRGVVAGTSAGAAMMSDPMIRWGTSSEALLAGLSEQEDRGVGIGRGMGFFPYGLTDQHFVERGRWGRLLVAMEHAGADLGFGIAENSALVTDLASHRMEIIGEHGVVVIDSREAIRSELGWENVRLSVLSDEEMIRAFPRRESFTSSTSLPFLGPFARTRSSITAHPATITITSARPFLAPPTGNETAELELGAFDRNALSEAMLILANPEVRVLRLPEEHFDITLTIDDRTRGFYRPGAERKPAFANLRVDIRPRPSAVQAAAELRERARRSGG